MDGADGVGMEMRISRSAKRRAAFLKNVSRNKLIVITCIAVCVACVLFYYITKKEENKIANNTVQDEEKSEDIDEVPESDFDLTTIEVLYKNEASEIDVKRLLEQSNQLDYFKYNLYDYLYQLGYKKIQKFEVNGGVKEETGQIFFQVNVITNAEEEMMVNCWYDENLYSYYFSFTEEELSAGVVEILEMDQDLKQILGSDLEEIEKKFGQYLYNEKIDATQARVTYYDIVETKVEIQVELNDEYMTYCKIYYNTDDHSFSFKIWE